MLRLRHSPWLHAVQIENARSMLPRDKITVVECAQDDSWFRDTGPVVSVQFSHAPIACSDAMDGAVPREQGRRNKHRVEHLTGWRTANAMP